MSPSQYESLSSWQHYRNEFLYECRKRLYNGILLFVINVGVWLYKINTIPTEKIGLLTFHIATITLVFFFLFDYARFRREIKNGAGLTAAYPVRPLNGAASPDRLNARQHRLGVTAVTRIVEKAQGDLRLLIVSGYYYIGTPQRPGQLWNLLSEHPGRIRILLLNPFPERFNRKNDKGPYPTRWQLPRRVHQVTGSYAKTNEYAQQLEDCVSALKQLRKQNRKVSVGFYNLQPRWQLFLTTKKAALQVVSLDYWSEYGPIFIFQQRPHSLFHHFTNAFDDMWREWRDDYRRHSDIYHGRSIRDV